MLFDWPAPLRLLVISAAVQVLFSLEVTQAMPVGGMVPLSVLYEFGIACCGREDERWVKNMERSVGVVRDFIVVMGRWVRRDFRVGELAPG